MGLVMIEGFDSGYADVNGTTLHYVAGGAGDPLVLLHGWSETWYTWHKVMPALARRRRVVAVDLRGIGGSGKLATGYDKTTMAEDVYELIRHLGYQRADIAGQDVGAMVAFSLAVNHPEAVHRLIVSEVRRWYGSGGQDISGIQTYGKLSIPVLGLGGLYGSGLQPGIEEKAADFRFVQIPHAGHYLAEENPDAVVKAINEFLT
jgi:pimeloyl-ACP methyl ester carboxylesterase